MNWKIRKNIDELDTYVGFRGTFSLEKTSEIEIQITGAHWFQAQLDNEFLTEGPVRFKLPFPEYEVIKLKLEAGNHVVSALVHDEGIDTRLLEGSKIPPFFFCKVKFQNKKNETLENLKISWKCSQLKGYISSNVRISPQLGWIEWVDTNENPEGWKEIKFDDSNWETPIELKEDIGEILPLEMGMVQQFLHPLSHIAKGTLSGPFEGAKKPDWPDEESPSWYKRDFENNNSDATWRRYDLGRIRLGRPEFVLDLPAGTVVEFALCEALRDGKVIPFIPHSINESRNLDHFIARGGVQTFSPITPKGGRFLEIHINALPENIKFIKENFVERCYFDKPEGSFNCNDDLLNKIWKTGIRTLRACAEDAVTDNPTRERGLWTGDALSSTTIAAAAYSDLRMPRHSLKVIADCAPESGMVAGLCPGHFLPIPNYALHWTIACNEYFKFTGDKEFLEKMFSAAENNMNFFERGLTDDGLVNLEGWNFYDWGYQKPEMVSNMVENIYYYSALIAMIEWAEWLDKDSSHYKKLAEKVKNIVIDWIAPLAEKNDWEKIEYHVAALACANKLVPEKYFAKTLNFVKTHLTNCFPNKLDAEQLELQSTTGTKFITPYFAYFVFPALIENGEMDFVLNQFRNCWGWMLDSGLSTTSELFNLGYSNCHVWSASPTAQLSKNVLGLTPRYDLGKRHFELKLITGSLKNAEGKIPLNGESKTINISWKKSNNKIEYSIKTPVQIFLHFKDKIEKIEKEKVLIF